LACGGLTNRIEILTFLQALPTCAAISKKGFLHFVDSYKLPGNGIGVIDAHLLAGALLNSNFLRILDTKLDAGGRKLKIAFS
jgi:hypothetical protein